MKKLTLLVAVSAISLSCEKENNDSCIDESLIKDNAICTMDYNPVCGCDGVTYPNACVAKFMHGVTSYREGACGSRLACIPVWPADPFLQTHDDPVNILWARIDSDCLIVKYSYAGGCENHQVRLQRMPLRCATPPVPPPTLELLHEANCDRCEALITEYQSFDLIPMRDSTKSQVEFYLTERHHGYRKRFVYQY